MKFELISLDPSSYYLTKVPINIDWWHVALLNAGTMFDNLAYAYTPIQTNFKNIPYQSNKI